MYGYTYERIPVSLDLDTYYKALLNYYGGDKKQTDDDYVDYMNSLYGLATEKNWSDNFLKAAYLHRSMRFVILTLVALMIAGIPALINHYHYQIQPRLENISQADNAKKQKELPMAEETPKPANTEKAINSQKPEGPKNIEVREGEVPKKKSGSWSSVDENDQSVGAAKSASPMPLAGPLHAARPPPAHPAPAAARQLPASGLPRWLLLAAQPPANSGLPSSKRLINIKKAKRRGGATSSAASSRPGRSGQRG